MSQSFYVKAIWDPEAEVWTSQSNIQGLVLETATLAEFESLAKHFAPELLAENLGLSGDVQVRFEAVRDLQLAAS